MAIVARRRWIGGAAALALTAFGADHAAAQDAPNADDIAIGRANAPVTLLEYGSAACSHCRAFEQASWEALKREYIDRGRVRFVFREALAPLSPDGSGTIESITLAMYQVSRCEGATPEQYFTRLGMFFERQPEIFRSGTMAAVLEHLVAVGADAGLTHDQVMGCIRDPAGDQRIRRLGGAFQRDAVAAGVPLERIGTPMFLLDGRRIDANSIMTPAGLRGVLDAALAARR